MFKISIKNLGEEESLVFIQGFRAVPYFEKLLNTMLEGVNGQLGNLDSDDPKMPIEYTRLRAKRDLLLEMIQVMAD